MSGEANITKVRGEDRELIQNFAKLTQEKKILVKGIVIGLQLEDSKEGKEKKKAV